MKPVNPDSAEPFYAQVMNALREEIQQGRWQPGDQLPSETELLSGFRVSRTVIRQSLDGLAREGWIVRRKGKGTFVAEPKVKESLVQRLTGFYQDMVDQGYTPVTQVRQQHVVAASNKVAKHLSLEPGAPVVEVERLRFVQDEPIVLVTTFIPYALCPGLLQDDLENQSLYALLENKYGLRIARGFRAIEAVQANEKEALLLNVPVRSPLILLRSASYLADDTPVEYYHAVHRGDRSRFEVELVRTREQANVLDALTEETDTLPQSHQVSPHK